MRDAAVQPAATEQLARDTALTPRDTDRQRQKELLVEAITHLPEREKLVITLNYYEGLGIEEIAEALGLTVSRVYQIHTKAILRLKEALEDMS